MVTGRTEDIKVTSVITALRGGDTEERIEREGEQSGEWIPTAGKKKGSKESAEGGSIGRR